MHDRDPRRRPHARHVGVAGFAIALVLAACSSPQAPTHELRLTLTGDGEGAFSIVGGGIQASCDTDCAVAMDAPLQVAITYGSRGSTGTVLGAWTGPCDPGALQPDYCLVSVNGITSIGKTWLHPPVAFDDAYAANRDAILVVAAAEGVLKNDEDTPGDVLTALLVDGPDHGALDLAADGGFRYTPDPGFEGSDTFRYRARDAFGNLSGAATIVLTVGNGPPVALDDAYTTGSNVPRVVAAPGVLGNDTDPNGDPLTALLVDGPDHGSLDLAADGGFRYTPDPGYEGSDTFRYRASDGDLQSEPATVVITVVNEPPVAADDAYATPADAPLDIAAPGVLGNDTDPNGDPLTALLVDGPDHGSLDLAADGGFRYTPDPGYEGSDTFRYRASDGDLQSELATVAIAVAR